MDETRTIEQRTSLMTSINDEEMSIRKTAQAQIKAYKKQKLTTINGNAKTDLLLQEIDRIGREQSQLLSVKTNRSAIISEMIAYQNNIKSVVVV
mmetsp:Transcript_11180/g.13476  ORF Transcript_11180/g.13476 Transcript_11180/m.13476 type:complete len:94 (+) Transcript_11180:444-725(+)